MNPLPPVLALLSAAGRALFSAFSPRNLLRGVWGWIKQKLVFWILISPLVFAFSTIWHVYQQGFQAGGWNDAPGRLIQPDVWMQAAARWTGVPAFITGTLAFLRSVGLGSFRQLFGSFHTVPAGIAAVIACFSRGAVNLRTAEAMLLFLGGGAFAGDLLLRLFPASLLLTIAVLLLLRGFGMAGALRQGSLAMDLSLTGWLASVAAGLGFLMSWLYLGFYGTLALIAGAVLWFRRTHPGPPSAPTSLICLFGIFVSIAAVADDGSWDEYSPGSGKPKTISGYLATKDGQKIIHLGLIGGGLATFGSIFGSLLGTLLGNAFKDQLSLLQGSQPPAQTTAPPPPPVPPTEIPSTVPDDGLWPPRIGTEQDGKVYCQPPWDEGGPVWIDKSEFDSIHQRQSQGYKWSNRHGWVLPEELAEREAIIERARQQNLQQSSQVKEAYDKWLESKRKLEEMQRQHAIQQKRWEVEALERASSRGVTDQDLKDLFWENVERDVSQAQETLSDADTYIKAADTILSTGEAVIDATTGLISHVANHPIDSLTKAADFTIGNIARGAGHLYENPSEALETAAVATGKAVVGLVKGVVIQPVTDMFDPNKTLLQRSGAVLMNTVGNVVMGKVIQSGLGVAGQVAGKMANKLGSLRRGVSEALESGLKSADDVAAAATRPKPPVPVLDNAALLDDQIAAMNRINGVFDGVPAKPGSRQFALPTDPAERLALTKKLIQMQADDPAAFNGARKAMGVAGLENPANKAVKDLTREFNERLIRTTDQALADQGYEVRRILVAGDTAGADLDPYFDIFRKMPDGSMQRVADADVQNIVSTTQRQLFKEDAYFKEFNVTPDDIHRNVINAHPEKFDNIDDPFRDLKVRTEEWTRTGDGGLSPTVTNNPPSMHRIPKAELLSDQAVHPTALRGYEKVLTVKMQDKIFSKLERGVIPSLADQVDTARELHKTISRTIEAAAEKLGIPLTADFKDAHRALAALSDPQNFNKVGVDFRHIQNVIQDQVSRLGAR